MIQVPQHLGLSMKSFWLTKITWACALFNWRESEPHAGREAAAPSIIKRIQIVHGREEVPPNGGIVHAQNAPMEPFFSKAKLNTRLSARLLGIMLRFDSFPRGHANLDGGHPGLSEDAFDGVLVPKVLFASFGPDVVQDEASEYVQGLS